jgi:hypothetical protein
MLGLNACRISTYEKPFQSFVSETEYGHNEDCNT